MASLKFTARGIAALKAPKSGRVDYWDESMANFGIRVSGQGAKTWITMYRHKGRKRRHTLGTFPAMTLADAYEKARISLNAAANGLDPAGDKGIERLAETFGELAHEYLEKYAKKEKRSWKLDQHVINRDLLPRWKNLKAKEIVRRDVIRLLDEVVERGAKIHANRVLALTRKMFNYAISRDIVQFNPCQAVPLPTKPQSRDRVLSEDEIRKVWIAADQDALLVGAMLKLRLLTAQRGGEIESMAWSDIDFKSGWWTIPAEYSKNGLSHRVPLSAQAVKVLNSVAAVRGDSKWVFPSPHKASGKHIENVQKAIQRIRDHKDCGVEFVGHDLRRTAASKMASIGVPRLVISKILNHVESGVTAVYDRHSYDAEKRNALEAWGKHVEKVVRKTERPGLRRDASKKHRSIQSAV